MAIDTDLPREESPRHRPKHKAGWNSRRSLKKESRRYKKRGWFRRWWWAFVLALPLLAVIAAGGALVWEYAHLEIPKAPAPLQTTYVYDSRGNPLTTFHAAVNRTLIPLSDMSVSLQHAVIATEDKDFYHHPGIDPVGIVRAAWADLTHGQITQGGSTITQQYVKNVYTGDERTIGRKVKEALLAIKLEQRYTKQQILEKYLNTIYFGSGAYGVQAAAKTFWNEDAKNLTLLQSATLAGAIAAPTRYDPLESVQGAAKQRRNYVLDQMVSQGYLSADRASQLKDKPVKTQPYVPPANPKLSFFNEYVKRSLIDKLAKTTTHGDLEAAAKLVYGGGLKVTTTLNPNFQKEAETAISDNLGAKGDPDAALVAIDPRTGAVEAMAGGHSYQQSQVNVATGYGSPGRQTGSAFKMFTLAAAMQQHFSLRGYWSGPQSVVISDPRCAGASGPWNPSNAGDGEAGTFTLADATAYSVNTVFAQLVVHLKNGPQDVVDMAHRLGIRSPLQPDCSITLGTQDVTPLEMTDSYATIAAEGVHHGPTPLQSVKSRKGQQLIQFPGNGEQELSKNNANLVTSALEGVLTKGTAAGKGIGRPAAGKTGTAQDYRNAWFCGYTPQLATCVWVGYLNTNSPLVNVEGVPEVFGGTIPATIWHDFMTQATQNMKVEDFNTPSQIGYTKGGSAPSPTPAPTPQPTPSTKHSPEPSPSDTKPSPTPTKDSTTPKPNHSKQP
ncbi:MAG: transglycosylase domain-containing protein [Actinomycetota bacterium]